MFVGEAPGEAEQFATPFLGYSGQELTAILEEVGIERVSCALTNVFAERPPNNKFHDGWCKGKKEASEAYRDLRPALVAAVPEYDWPSVYTWAAVATGKYVMPEHLSALQRLREEILLVRPNVIVALGGTASWALLGTSGIKKIRGTTAESSLVPGQKVLPTWHPAYIQRAWTDRVTLVTDLQKAKTESAFPDIRRPRREIWTNPDLSDLQRFFNEHIVGAELLAFDTETAHRQITCITFAPRKDLALAVPFVDKSRSGYHYWESAAAELAAMKFVQRVLATNIPKVAQNGLYDMQYLWVIYGIKVRNLIEDTMLLHHALFLELPKDLGFLGSVYTSEASWKLMRTRSKDIEEKKDD